MHLREKLEVKHTPQAGRIEEGGAKKNKKKGHDTIFSKL